MSIKMPRIAKLSEPSINGNPFLNDCNYSTWTKFKIFLGGITLFPIRLAINIAVILVVLPLVRLAAMGLKPNTHLKPWQKFIMVWIIPPVLRFWLVFGFGFHWIAVKGRRAATKEAPILVIAPHSSVMDSWMLSMYAWGSVMSRRENEKMPVAGTCLKSCEPIWVDRNPPPGSMGTVEAIVQRVLSSGFWAQIVMFPEGTTHNTDSIIGFKTGAFRPGFAVQPIVWKFNRDPGFGIWSHYGNSIPKCLFMLMCTPHNSCEVEYLPVYTPDAAEKQQPRLFANNVRDLMAKALNKPITDYGLEDLRLVQKAVEHGLPHDAALIEFNKVNAAYKLQLSDLMPMLDRFIDMNNSKSGRVTEEEFLRYFRWPVEEHVRLLFNIYDTCSECKELRYREYVVGVHHLATSVPDHFKPPLESLTRSNGQISPNNVLSFFHDHGYQEVLLAHVQALLYRVSQDQDLTQDGFSTFLEHQPDVKVLLFWITHGPLEFEEETSSSCSSTTM